MHLIQLLAISTMLLASTLFSSEDENGAELFNDAKCMRCHSSAHFKPKEDKVSSFPKLQKSVKACALNTNTAWFDEETKEVVHYLNNKYYKFEKPPITTD